MSACPASTATLVRRYLQHRRSFGYQLQGAGHYLAAFAQFMDRKAPRQPLTTKLALKWARAGHPSPMTVAMRLSAVRGFARYCATFDERTQIPPSLLSHCRSRRRAPHIFSAAQVRLILHRTKQLRPFCTNLRPITYRTFIGLLACSGLRPTEALRLRDEHFDAGAATLDVPPVKCSPGRKLPLHASTVRALQHYRRLRRSQFPCATHFFVGPFGRPLQLCAVEDTFRRLTRGIPGNGWRPHPRLYDFRHTYATNAVARWSKRSVPLAHHLVLLSRYLGHKDFHQTYWYVEHDIQALQTASGRFERYRKQSNSA